MRLLTDQDVYARTVAYLRSLGHEVETASEAGLALAEDDRIVEYCASSGRALVSRDKDHGYLIFAEGLACPGVILIRAPVPLLDQAHAQLKAALEAYPADLAGLFIVIEPFRYRVRHSG